MNDGKGSKRGPNKHNLIASVGCFVTLTWTVKSTLDTGDLFDSFLGGVAVGFAAIIVCYPLYFVGYTLFHTMRFGVRSAVLMSRTMGLGDIHEKARGHLGDRGIGTEFAIGFDHAGGWDRLVLRRLLRWSFGAISALGLIVWLISKFVPMPEWAPLGWHYTAQMVAPVVAILFFLFRSAVRVPRLPKVAFAAIRTALEGKAANIRTEAQPGNLDFGKTGRIIFALDQEHHDVLQFRVRLWKASVGLVFVERGTLGAEDMDVDIGQSVFDRATILTIGRRSQQVVEAWLTPEVCTLLLAALLEGAIVEDGFLVLRVNVRQRFGHIPRLIPLIGCLERACSERSALSPEVRALSALEGSTDAGRLGILNGLCEIGKRASPDVIRQRWATEGSGPTRVRAATDLPPGRSEEALAGILAQPGGSANVRSLALLNLLRNSTLGNTQAKEWLARLGDTTDAELASVAVAFAKRSDRRASAALSELTVPGPGAGAGLGAAALALVAVAHRERWVPFSENFVSAIRQPLDTLPTGPGALALWQTFGEIVAHALTLKETGDGGYEALEATAAVIRKEVEASTALRRGGLSIAQEVEAGGLALSDTDGSGGEVADEGTGEA